METDAADCEGERALAKFSTQGKDNQKRGLSPGSCKAQIFAEKTTGGAVDVYARCSWSESDLESGLQVW